MFMKRIFYGVNGEGLGHSTRAAAIIENLPDCETHVFTYGRALEFFKQMKHPHLHEIDGVTFSYKDSRVDYVATACRLYRYVSKELQPILHKVALLASELKPSLVLTDFEPSLSRVASSLGLPLVSVDSQHRFDRMETNHLPLSLRAYCWFVGKAVRWVCPRPDHTIISCFHGDRLNVSDTGVTVVNGLLRKEFDRMVPRDDGYLLVYCRQSMATTVLKSLEHLEDNVVVMDSGIDAAMRKRLEQRPNFRICGITPRFGDYLGGCRGVIANAGNQLLAEARFLRKPVLAIPETGQHEQEVNACHVEALRMGRQVSAKDLNRLTLNEFIKSIPEYYIDEDKPLNGTQPAIDAIRRYL
jgi:uncharacterized protein (TIGR00661 family)